MMKIKYHLAFIAVLLTVFVACKKSKKETTTDPTNTTNPTNPTSSRADLTRDSVFLYAKEIYLWNTALPSYETFNPRKYTGSSTDLGNYQTELFDITKYSIPYEYKAGATSSKFSFIADKTTQNPSAQGRVASVDTEGNGNDIGVRVGYYGSQSNFTLYVTAVYQNSPAEKAGFVRGDKITKINGASYGSNFDGQINAILTALSGSSVTLEGIKGGSGAAFSTTLTKSVFKSSPIYNTRVFTAGSKKIGYLAYARFSISSNSEAALNTAFSTFSANGVTDLIIDLRYNGGGYVNTAEHLINLIAPSSANGKVMFTEHFNATMQSGNAKILTNQPLLDASGKIQYQNGRIVTYNDADYTVAENTYYVTKAGSLNSIQNVVFIVSPNTASASELTINSLKPYMNVKLVGQTSYGKPVGFFPVTIENKYEVYFSMFESKNSLGAGGYYDGLTPDVSDYEVPSGTMMYDFGNPNDNYIGKALNILAPGVQVSSTSVNSTMTSAQKQSLILLTKDVIDDKIDGKEFNGMIENRIKPKK